MSGNYLLVALFYGVFLCKKAENDTRKGVGALLTSQNNTTWMIYTRATGQALSWADFYVT